MNRTPGFPKSKLSALDWLSLLIFCTVIACCIRYIGSVDSDLQLDPGFIGFVDWLLLILFSFGGLPLMAGGLAVGLTLIGAQLRWPRFKFWKFIPSVLALIVFGCWATLRPFLCPGEYSIATKSKGDSSLPDFNPNSGASLRLRILHANIYRFNVESANLQRIADLALGESVDILILHEFREEQQIYLDSQLIGNYPYRLSSTEHPYFGFGIYSNRPFTVRNLIAGRIEALASIRVQASAECDGLFDLLAVHPVAPFNPRILGVHRRTMSSLAQEIATRRSPIPVVLTGDFNSVEWSPDRRSLVRKSGLRQLASANRWEQIFRGTYDARWWDLLRLPIDAILVSSDIRVLEFRHLVIPGSDHLGLLADLQIPDPANCASLRNFHKLSP